MAKVDRSSSSKFIIKGYNWSNINTTSSKYRYQINLAITFTWLQLAQASQRGGERGGKANTKITTSSCSIHLTMRALCHKASCKAKPTPSWESRAGTGDYQSREADKRIFPVLVISSSQSLPPHLEKNACWRLQHVIEHWATGALNSWCFCQLIN